jgi:uncharacterized protein HemX
MAQSKGMMIIVALVVAVAIGGGGFWYYTKQKAEASRKAAVTDALARANEVQSKVLQYYFKNKEFPSSNEQAGIPRPESFQMESLKSITIGKDGRINLLLNSQSGIDNGAIVLVPTMDIASGKLWRCETASYPDISQYCPECVFAGNR